MADRIEWFLNANSSQVRAEMTQTVQAVNSGANQIVQGYNRADLASGNLLKSNSRVASSGIHVAQAMLSGGSAVDIFASSLMGLERATRLPLGALLGLGVAAVAISKIHGVVVEFQALNKEADALEKKDLIKVKTAELEKVKSDAERVKKGLEEQQGFFKRFARFVAGDPLMAISPPIGLFMGARADALKAKRGMESDDPSERIWEANRGKREAFAKEQAELYHAKRLADIPKEVDAELEKRRKDAELGKEATSFKEKLQLSLADIAKGGLHARDSGAFDNTKQYAGDVAERALKEEALARKAILGQDYAGAVQHQSLAETLKAQIPGLKDSDKISTFRSALDTSERLRELVQKVSFERRQ